MPHKSGTGLRICKMRLIGNGAATTRDAVTTGLPLIEAIAFKG